MCRKIGALAVAATLFLSSTALGAAGPYLKGHLGGSFVNDITFSQTNLSSNAEFDPGFNLGAGIGYNWGAARLEGEVAYAQNDVDTGDDNGTEFRGSGDISALSLMLNGYLDLGTFHFFSGPTAEGQQTPALSLTPFVGAGIGAAQLSIDESQLGPQGADEDDVVAAGQIGAGVGIALNELLTLDLSYRYFITEDPNFGGVDGEYDAHNLLVGLRYGF